MDPFYNIDRGVGDRLIRPDEEYDICSATAEIIENIPSAAPDPLTGEPIYYKMPITDRQAKSLVKDLVDQQKFDPVYQPQHYIRGGLETIDVIMAFTENLNGIEAVCTGNALKYICRWKEKNGIEDLEKARWYISYLIDELKDREDESSR